jgi:carbonic anhydrase/acetyltransferase-like protein (isoleucine patch superfamily)
MEQYTDICEQYRIQVAGIFDNDYYSNTEHICGVPVIGTEKMLLDSTVADSLKEKYNFFCPVNGLPLDTPVHQRNKDKRQMLLNLIDDLDLPCISLISKQSVVSPSARIGKGCFINHFSVIEPNVTLGDFSSVHIQSFVGFNTVVGKNCTFNRQTGVGAKSIIGDNVYLSPLVKVAKENIVLGENSWVQEAIYLKRGTLPGEVVSLNGSNTKRVESLNNRTVE